jgi:release factor glutamine methyltransferase
MMNSAQARHDVVEALLPAFGEQEAKAMARLLLFDMGQHPLHPEQMARLQTQLEQLLEGRPIQYVLGHTVFYGYQFRTDQRALIPRPETEELVRVALEFFPDQRLPLSVLDIGTGSACIPITLKLKRPHWNLTSVDLSHDALALAAENAALHQVDIQFNNVDILDPLSSAKLGQYDLIIANPPYIPEREKKLMSSSVLNYEPSLALFVPDEDPLIFYRAIADFALNHSSGGTGILLELNEFLAEETSQLFADKCGENPEIHLDMQQKPRILWVRNCKIPQ